VSPTRPREPTFFVEWSDAEKQTHPYTAYWALLVGILLFAVMLAVSRVGAVVLAVALVAWFVASRRRARPSGVLLQVEDGVLSIGADAEKPVVIPLASLREVEMDSKAIQRLTMHQEVGAAMPSTRVSGDVDVARIVFVLEAPAPPVRLTETFTSYSICQERFGKVRVFLRAHGWLPVGERD
jgi:hypothetical protein